MSKTTVKKALKDLTADQLRGVILELYDNRTEAKEFLDYWADPDPEREIEKYKLKISKVFLIGENRPRKSPDFKELKKLLKDFSSLYMDNQQLIEMNLYAMEIYLMWLKTRTKVIAQQARYESMCKSLDEMLDMDDTENIFSLRWNRIKDEFDAIFRRGNLKTRRRWRRWLR